MKQSVLILILFSLFLVACGEREPEPTPTPEPFTITVGIATAETGSQAVVGESVRRGAALALAHVAEQGYLQPNITLTAVYGNTASNREQTVQLYEKLINVDVVSAIIGPTSLDAALAANPIAQAAGVPVLDPVNGDVAITDMGEYIFRVRVPDNRVLDHALGVLLNRRAVDIVTLMYAQDDPLGQSRYDGYLQALNYFGVTILNSQPYNSQTTDFTPQLDLVTAGPPEAIIISAGTAVPPTLLEQLSQRDLPDVYILGDIAFATLDLATLPPALAPRLITGTDWWPENPAIANQNFLTAYQAEYGAPPDRFAAYGYTAVWAIAAAARQAQSPNRESLRQNLYNIDNIPSPLDDRFYFDQHKNPRYEPVALRVENGRFVLFE